MKSITKLSVFVAIPLLISLSVASCNPDVDSSDSKRKQESSVQTDPSEASEANPQDLRTASLNGQTNRVDQAIEQGVDVNATDETGNTPLMLASYNGHTEIVKQLLESGARLQARNQEGRTALMFAATGSFPETVEVLLEAGADPNATGNVEEWSPLMFASAEGHIDVVETLLNYGADPSLTDSDGDTALTFARDNSRSAIVRLLEQAGANQ